MTKTIDMFYLHDGYPSSPCKQCIKDKVRLRYYTYGKEKIKKYEYKRARQRERVIKHNIYVKRNTDKKKGLLLDYLPKRVVKNHHITLRHQLPPEQLKRRRAYESLWKRNKWKRDIQFKLKNIIRTCLCSAIRNKQKKGSSIRDLGCSIEFLKNYLESQFTVGMTWENWSRTGWNIDHIKPLSKFNLSNREQFLEAVNYKNLQPLWWKDNNFKRAK